jgi:hypothetical protein
MKKGTKIVILLVALVVTFFLGRMVGTYEEMPKFVRYDELQKTYPILTEYRGWTSAISTDSGKTYHSSEIKLPRVPIQYGFGVSCEDGSPATYKLYSAFGNSKYAQLMTGGIFDGYFSSVRVIDCKDHYYINENGNNEYAKYYGPFYFSSTK